jgi:hypothetical protein
MIRGIQGRNLDGRTTPQPDCTCFICGGPAKLLRQMPHPDTGNQTAGCATCYQKSQQTNARLKETCPRCDKRVEWLKEAADDGQPVCLTCYDRTVVKPVTAQDAPLSAIAAIPAVVQRINPATGEISYEVRPVDFSEAPRAVASELVDPDALVFGFLAQWYLAHPELLHRVVCGDPVDETRAARQSIDAMVALCDLYGETVGEIVFTGRKFHLASKSTTKVLKFTPRKESADVLQAAA